jgi:hypothetical protein
MRAAPCLPSRLVIGRVAVLRGSRYEAYGRQLCLAEDLLRAVLIGEKSNGRLEPNATEIGAFLS